MARRVLLTLLLVASAVTAVVAAAYGYGRSQCPPPHWWFDPFNRSGNFACVAGPVEDG